MADRNCNAHAWDPPSALRRAVLNVLSYRAHLLSLSERDIIANEIEKQVEGGPPMRGRPVVNAIELGPIDQEDPRREIVKDAIALGFIMAVAFIANDRGGPAFFLAANLKQGAALEATT